MSANPAPTAEDRRNAANMQAAISTYVSSAALAVLGAEGAVYLFYAEHRTINTLGEFLFGAVVVCVVASMIFGGQGTNKLSSNGYMGNWNIFDEVSNLFAVQGFLTLASVVCLTIVVFFGTGPSHEAEEQTRALQRLTDQQAAERKEIGNLESQLKRLHK